MIEQIKERIEELKISLTNAKDFREKKYIEDSLRLNQKILLAISPVKSSFH